MKYDIKNIIVIDSLGKEDGVNFTGETLYNDFIKRRIELTDKKINHYFHKVETSNQFLEILQYYSTNSPCLQGGVIIHLEMHGSKNLDGLICADGSLIEWEKSIELFRQINVITCNKLFITMGTCYGRYLYKAVDPYKKSPYSGYISASITVTPEEVYEKFGILFEEIINNKNIVDAYIEMEKTESNFYYKDSESTFDNAFESILNKIKNDPNLKNEFINNAIMESKNSTGYQINDKEADYIFNIALKNLYIRQKAAFDFSDC